MSWKKIAVTSAAVAVAARLATALKIGPGTTIANIGAGNGALAVELAAIAGSAGRTFATERTPGSVGELSRVCHNLAVVFRLPSLTR